MTGPNPYAEKARLKKVHAVAGRIDCRALEQGLNPHLSDVAKEFVAKLEAATDSDWAALESDAKQNRLSPESRLMLVNIFRQRAGMPIATTKPTAAPVAPVALGKCTNGCGRERDNATDGWCSACDAGAFSDYMTNAGGIRTDELLAGRAAAAHRARR